MFQNLFLPETPCSDGFFHWIWTKTNIPSIVQFLNYSTLIIKVWLLQIWFSVEIWNVYNFEEVLRFETPEVIFVQRIWCRNELLYSGLLKIFPEAISVFFFFILITEWYEYIKGCSGGVPGDVGGEFAHALVQISFASSAIQRLPFQWFSICTLRFSQAAL